MCLESILSELITISKTAARTPMREYLEQNGYFNVRELPDGGWVANMKLIYTTALVIDMDYWGFDRRYCYNTREEAIAACNALTSVDDEPLPGYVAKRSK